MCKKIRILISNVTSPWFNLATEDWIFNELTADTQILFLWRNMDSVIIGHFQNPWVECKIDKMEADNVFLARRQSGGGAVFHDLGNTNFTFLSPKQDYDQSANFAIIQEALTTLGIHSILSGRNDLQVENKKISGSAFKHKADRAFHHGTLLVNADMDKLSDYLQPHPLKLAAKGIKSVRSRVANLVDFNPAITHEILCEAIIEAFEKHYQQEVEVEVLDEKKLAQLPALQQYYAKMADWDWRFGKTPEFTHQLETRFNWGIVDFRLCVDEGRIIDVALYSDALDVNMIAGIKRVLIGQPYIYENIRNTLHQLTKQHAEWAEPIAELTDWLKTQIQ